MQNFLGEIKMFAGNFAPLGWAFCDGSLLPISQYAALFNLVGTTYGGNGTTTFALPDLRGRVPVHQGIDSFGDSYPMGELLGEETVALTSSTMPGHVHTVAASSSAPSNAASPIDLTGTTASLFCYGSPAAGAMSPLTVGNDPGGGLPHNNVAPFLCISFIIALQGIFPSQA
jgi:microcystin-dependent protein